MMLRRSGFIAIVLVLIAAGARAQDVGTVAVAEGSAEIGRAGTLIAATVGMAVARGDELRTGSTGHLKVVFQDSSVLNLSDGTRVIVDDQIFSPDEGRFWSAVRMVQGKVRAVVSDYYRQAGASYEIETPTAVAGVRGTTFLVTYNPTTDTTEVVGIDGQVEVHSLADRLAAGVFVSPQESTTVLRGARPTTPQPLGDDLFHQRLEGVQFSGVRAAAGALGGAGASASRVPAADRAPAVANDVFQHNLREFRDTSDTIGQPTTALSSRGRLGVPF